MPTFVPVREIEPRVSRNMFLRRRDRKIEWEASFKGVSLAIRIKESERERGKRSESNIPRSDRFVSLDRRFVDNKRLQEGTSKETMPVRIVSVGRMVTNLCVVPLLSPSLS